MYEAVQASQIVAVLKSAAVSYTDVWRDVRELLFLLAFVAQAWDVVAGVILSSACTDR